MRHLAKKHKCEHYGDAGGKVRGITKVIKIHPLGTVDVCTIFSRQDIQEVSRYFRLGQTGEPTD